MTHSFAHLSLLLNEFFQIILEIFLAKLIVSIIESLNFGLLGSIVVMDSHSLEEDEEIQERLIKLTVSSKVTLPSSSCRVEMKFIWYLSLLSKLIFDKGIKKRRKSELVVAECNGVHILKS